VSNEERINSHLAEFMELLENGELKQLVMENDEPEDDFVFSNESSEEYKARMSDPHNYGYIINRCNLARGAV